jgi:hypothetical protein
MTEARDQHGATGKQRKRETEREKEKKRKTYSYLVTG